MKNKIIRSEVQTEIQNLSLENMKELLKSIKLYKDLTKKLWVRWRVLFKKWLTWKNELVVEYFPSISEEWAFEKAKIVYDKMFSLDVTMNEIKFISNKELCWGIKVYLDDSMVDLSFFKVEYFIKE